MSDWWKNHKPFWLMYPPHKYIMFRVQTVRNWYDRHMHITTEKDWPRCHYCKKDGGQIFWRFTLCRKHNAHIIAMVGEGRRRRRALKTLGYDPFEYRSAIWRRRHENG